MLRGVSRRQQHVQGSPSQRPSTQKSTSHDSAVKLRIGRRAAHSRFTSATPAELASAFAAKNQSDRHTAPTPTSMDDASDLPGNRAARGRGRASGRGRGRGDASAWNTSWTPYRRGLTGSSVEAIDAAAAAQDETGTYRDRYGFALAESTSRCVLGAESSRKESRRRAERRAHQQWQMLLAAQPELLSGGNQPSRNAPWLLRLVRRGLPHERRGVIWFAFSGGAQLSAENPSAYTQLCDQVVHECDRGLSASSANTLARQATAAAPAVSAPAHSEESAAAASCSAASSAACSSSVSSTSVSRRWSVVEQVLKDVPRTFPGHPRFSGPLGLSNALRRVLLAYSRRNPSVGYCQGMNFVAGFLLLHMPEEHAFWTLCAVVELHMRNYFDQNMIGLQVDERVLEECLERRLPRLHRHLAAMGFPYNCLSTRWFMCLYLNSMPTETTLRVWDCFFCMGPRTLILVALALFVEQESTLLRATEVSTVLTTLVTAAQEAYDHDRLLKHAFRCMSAFTKPLSLLRLKHWSVAAHEHSVAVTPPPATRPRPMTTTSASSSSASSSKKKTKATASSLASVSSSSDRSSGESSRALSGSESETDLLEPRVEYSQTAPAHTGPLRLYGRELVRQTSRSFNEADAEHARGVVSATSSVSSPSSSESQSWANSPAISPRGHSSDASSSAEQQQARARFGSRARILHAEEVSESVEQPQNQQLLDCATVVADP